MPKIHLTYLEDDRRHRLYRRAIDLAVSEISDQRDLDCRALNLGCGSGLNAMVCLEAGAVVSFSLRSSHLSREKNRGPPLPFG